MPAQKAIAKKRKRDTNDVTEEQIDGQVTRLRNVLSVMAMTARTAALGADNPPHELLTADTDGDQPSGSLPARFSSVVAASASARSRR